MAEQTVEFVCTTCGLAEEAPVAASRTRIVICDCCGGRMVVSLDDADEATRSFQTGQPVVSA